MAARFFESVYKYTDPVRYFKANDPYYYEVDNIPLKQLQENCNFLKDQVSNLVPDDLGVVSREDISELKPYVDGTDNKVKIRPGRYTARINDAYNLESLQSLTQQTGLGAFGEHNGYSFKTTIDSALKQSLDKLKAIYASNSLNMNGLFERSFTFAMQNNDLPSIYQASDAAEYSLNQDGLQVAYPNVTGRLPTYQTQFSSIFASVYDTVYGTIGAVNFENEFIKKWRGVTRTAIVDVKEELSIDIPPFDDDDFYYINEAGNKIKISGATQRIDLVFIYSKPIDSSSTTISRFVNGLPVKINKPTIGIVKGAGVGIDFSRITGLGKNSVSIVDADGNPLILPSIGDEEASNIGFENIAGSFPSPDDLMNLTPLLSENLESTNFALIGQSILPVAYVVVKKNSEININSNNIIELEDLIDIRPFFRTTELSYNERSGLAAATPPASLANPVATEIYVDEVARNIKTEINRVENIIASPPLTPRIVGAGYIKGGGSWGVESTLSNFVNIKTGGTLNSQQLKATVIENFDYPVGTTINDLPDWDIADWCINLPIGQKGLKPHDYINFAVRKNVIGVGPSNYANYGYSNATGGKSFSTYPTLEALQGGWYNFYYVSKTVRIDRSLVPWMTDYRVNVNFHNCIPLSQRENHTEGGPSEKSAATLSNVWVSKRNFYNNFEFTIFVAWPAIDLNPDMLPGGSPITPYLFREPITNANNSVVNFNGFAVITKEMLSEIEPAPLIGNSSLGVALYPTVSFEVIGIPEGYGSTSDFRTTNVLALK